MISENVPPSGTIKLVPIELLKPDPLQPRRTMVGDLSELAGSISAIGMVEPIRARPDGDGYIIEDGHRRVAAATLAKMALVPILLDPEVRSPVEICERQLATFGRSDLNPMDRSDCLKRLLDQSGRGSAELARRVGISPGQVSKLLTLQLLRSDDQARVRSGELGLVEGYRRAIGRSPSKPATTRVHEGPRSVARARQHRSRPARLKIRESVTLTIGSSCGATLDEIVADLGRMVWRLGTLQGKSVAEAISLLTAGPSPDPPETPELAPS